MLHAPGILHDNLQRCTVPPGMQNPRFDCAVVSCAFKGQLHRIDDLLITQVECAVYVQIKLIFLKRCARLEIACGALVAACFVPRSDSCCLNVECRMECLHSVYSIL